MILVVAALFLSDCHSVPQPCEESVWLSKSHSPEFSIESGLIFVPDYYVISLTFTINSVQNVGEFSCEIGPEPLGRPSAVNEGKQFIWQVEDCSV